MFKNKIINILLLGFFLTSSICAQWKAVYPNEEIYKVHYSLQKENLKPVKKLFDFPLKHGSDSNLIIGYNLIKYKKLKYDIKELNDNHKQGNLYFWLKEFKATIKCQEDSTIIYTNLYSKNISSYKIYLHSRSSDKWYSKEIKDLIEGYQIPVDYFINEWQSLNILDTKNNHKKFYDSTKIQYIDKFLIVVEPKNKDFNFTVNNIVIGDRRNNYRECIHPFIDKLFGKEGNSDTLLKSDCFINNNYISSILSTQERYKLELFANYFEFIKGNNNDNEIRLSKQLLDLVIKEYPFYKERSLNKEEIKKRYDLFCLSYSDTSNIYDFAKALSAFIKEEFKDGHFYIDPPYRKNDESNQEMAGPISLFEIDNKVLVAAVFDSVYTSKMPLNTEVIAINKISIKHVIDSLSTHQYGTIERKRRRAISICLYRQKNDSCVITLKTKNGIADFVIKYDHKILIPDNFKQEYYAFKLFNNNIAFFRASRMDGWMYLRFLNNYEKIRNTKGLIIDLRGNVGGSSSDGINIFSLFIDKPRVFHYTIPFNQPNVLESLVIKPNKKYHFPNSLQVIILGDENTACASEDFMQAMQQLENCRFLGTSRTCGALQNRYGIRFPSGTFLSIDCLSPKIVGHNYGVIECKGVEPDIWVLRTKIEDLIPYNDKVLQAAIRILE